MSKRIVPALVFLTALAVRAGGLGVTPPYVELALEPGASAEEGVTAFAVDATFAQVTARVVDFTKNERGAVVVLDPGELPHSAASWIEIKTPPFALADKERVTVEFAVHVPPGVNGGSYTAGILIEPAEAPPAAKHGKRLLVRSRILVPVLIKIPGTLRPGYRLVKVERKEDRLRLLIENTGNVYLSLDGRVRFISPAGEVVHELRAPHVFLDRGARAAVEIPLPGGESGAVAVTVEYWANGYELPRLYAEEVIAQP